MSMGDVPAPMDFIVTKEHRRFVEFCDACRRYRYIGLCFGAPGVGKTISARTYAQQDLVEHLQTDCHRLDLPATPAFLRCVAVFYTPTVVNSPWPMEKDIVAARQQLDDLHYWMRGVVEAEATTTCLWTYRMWRNSSSSTRPIV